MKDVRAILGALAWFTAIIAPGISVHAQTLETLPFDKKLKLAKAGDEDAQVAVARAYEEGNDTDINKVEAAKWFRKAADQGNIEAMFRLARIVSEGAQGIKKSPELAAKLYESAARQGHVEAQNWLGYSYQHGLGIQQSDASAVEWYKKAADAGLAVGQNNLGLMYLNGKGVPRDYGKAFVLFEQAAKQDDAWGLNNLGGLYEMGWGVKQDREKALAYYKRANEKGNQRAGENMKRLSAALGSKEPASTTTVSPPPTKAVKSDSSSVD
jgi:TPR repeat protein